MHRPDAARLLRFARKPPRYVVRRIAAEISRELDHRKLRSCAEGRGALTFDRILPGDGDAAYAYTAESAPRFGAFHEAISASRSDRHLRDALQYRAAKAAERRIELFGAEPVYGAAPPAWNRDPITGDEWPRGFHRRLDVFDLKRNTDIKLVWELSRLRHCVTLAQAVAVCDDERALGTLSVDLADWRGENPLGWSVNWTVAMEVALRAVNLICVDGVLLASGRNLPIREELVASLYQHGWFLERNLEIGDINGNHFLANAVGLLWLGRYFGDIGDGARWFSRGVEMTGEAAVDQVLDDGLDHEGSLPYHVLVTEMFLMALVAGGQALRGIHDRVAKLVDAMVLFTDDRGYVPDLGDDDGGRVAAFADAPAKDARRVLAMGAALLQDAAAAQASVGGDGEDAIWLIGLQRLEEARSSAPEPLPRSPVIFPSAGVVIMRGGQGDRIAVDVGPIGFRGRGGHGHVDAMSFEARLGGHLAVRDSGTGSYTGDAALRNELRSASAHNVVLLDQLPYARVGGPDRLWIIDGDAPPEIVRMDIESGEQVIVAVQQLPSRFGSATFERQLSLAPGLLSCTDTIRSSPGSAISHLLQLPAEVELTNATIVHPALTYSCEMPSGAALKLLDCPWSKHYGHRGVGKRAVIECASDGEPVQIRWTIGVR